jgi:hypothetical protein
VIYLETLPVTEGRLFSNIQLGKDVEAGVLFYSDERRSGIHDSQTGDNEIVSCTEIKIGIPAADYQYEWLMQYSCRNSGHFHVVIMVANVEALAK